MELDQIVRFWHFIAEFYIFITFICRLIGNFLKLWICFVDKKNYINFIRKNSFQISIRKKGIVNWTFASFKHKNGHSQVTSKIRLGTVLSKWMVPRTKYCVVPHCYIICEYTSFQSISGTAVTHRIKLSKKNKFSIVEVLIRTVLRTHEAFKNLLNLCVN